MAPRQMSDDAAHFKPPALPFGSPTGEQLLSLLRSRREKGEQREQEHRRSFKQLEKKLTLAEQYAYQEEEEEEEKAHMVAPPKPLQRPKSLRRRSFSGESSLFSSDSDEFSGKFSARSSDSDEFSTRGSARSLASGASIGSGANGTPYSYQFRHLRPWR